jgi:glycosyltransferase involved in cell wall biosynthesis
LAILWIGAGFDAATANAAAQLRIGQDVRVLLAHNNFAIMGGAEVFYHEVGRVLSLHGHAVSYFSAADNEADNEWSEYFPQVVDYRSGKLLTSVLSFPRMIYSGRSKKAFKKLIHDFGPDIVHVFGIYVKLTPSILEAAKEAGIPVIMSCNDYKHICPNYKLYHHGRTCEECKGGKFYRAIVNSCCHQSLTYSVASAIEAYVHQAKNIYRSNVTLFSFSSRFMARKTEEFWGQGNFDWKILRNPFESRGFEASFCPDGPALFVGRIIEEKGLDVLLNAAEKVPNVEIRIVGDGPDVSRCREIAVDLGLQKVSFVGAKWGEELDAELRASRFVVVPSLWHENYPYVINQAFAFGKPVVGSNRGGIPELVEDGERGLIYEATSSVELAAAINFVWEDAAAVERLGKNSKEFANREFNDERFYVELERLYSEAIA